MIAGILQAGTGSGIAGHSPVMVCRVLERGSRRGRPAGGNALLLPLFAVGGVGLGMNYTALTGQMTGGVLLRLAAAIGGVSAILLSIGGSISVAAVGSLYLSLAHTGTAADRDPATAVRAFAVPTAALAGIGVLAILAAHQATQPPAAPASQERPMPDELLMIMTSNGTLGDSGRPTGVWVEEVCVPLKAFRDAGFIVSAASPLGGRPPIDPRSAGFDTSTVPDLEAWLDGARVLADVDPRRYAAVFLAGGHGTMWDFPGQRGTRPGRRRRGIPAEWCPPSAMARLA